ncbi:MAG TPA: xylulokinase [Candidatus Marinimicrobia bacterium]|nr:xylulokinase [Candidatus Neomarinimicrobiota bacterium]
MFKLFAGLDVSTQSTKLVIIDLKTEEVVYVNSVNYDADLPHYNTENGAIKGLGEGVSESDPKMWIEAVDRVFESAKNAGIAMAQIGCIAVSGQQHGLVALDAKGNLARPRSKLWNDFSTLEECEILTEKVGGLEQIVQEVGNSQRTGYTAAKIFHMVRHEPETYRRTATLFLVHNYMNYYLTGGVCVMEPGDASGMALWNPANGQWSQKVIAAIAPDLAEKLPEIKPSDRTIGAINPELAAKFGFSEECRIDAGCGDNMYGAVGTGNVEPGIVTVSLGTSGTAYTFMEKPYIDPTGEIAAFCDSTGHYLPLLCVSNLANGYNEFLKIHGLSHAEFDNMLDLTPAANNGRILIPWYVGERTPDVPLAAPLYFGFGLADFTQEKLSRAIIEGHILNLYTGFKRMPVKVREIRLTGGLSRSDTWCQTIADIFEAETVRVAGEGAALGAALHAAWVWKKEREGAVSLADLVKPFVVLDEKHRRQPIQENVKVYRKQKELFDALSKRIRGLDGADPFKLRSEIL